MRNGVARLYSIDNTFALAGFSNAAAYATLGGFLMSQFKPGQVVRLKSGGPIMTVEGDDMAGRVICTWFDEKNKPQSRGFAAESLKSADNDDTPSVG